PALAVIAFYPLVHFRDVRAFRLFYVPFELFAHSGTAGENAGEDELGERAGHVEVRAGRLAALAGFDPVAFDAVLGARDRLLGLGERLVLGLGENARIVPVGSGDHVALVADVERAAAGELGAQFLFEGLDRFRPLRVVAIHLHGRHVAA